MIDEEHAKKILNFAKCLKIQGKQYLTSTFQIKWNIDVRVFFIINLQIAKTLIFAKLAQRDYYPLSKKSFDRFHMTQNEHTLIC
jgi:hypothetical protein